MIKNLNISNKIGSKSTVDETMNETFGYATKFNDENVELEPSNLINKNQQQQIASKQNLKDKIKLQNLTTNLTSNQSVNKKEFKKRKLSHSSAVDHCEQPLVKKAKRKQQNYFYLFIELQFTGLSSTKDEIVKLSAFKNSSINFTNFAFPIKKEMANKTSELTNIQVDIQVDNKLMLYHGRKVNCTEIKVALTEFLDFLESLNANNIVLGNFSN